MAEEHVAKNLICAGTSVNTDDLADFIRQRLCEVEVAHVVLRPCREGRDASWTQHIVAVQLSSETDWLGRDRRVCDVLVAEPDDPILATCDELVTAAEFREIAQEALEEQGYGASECRLSFKEEAFQPIRGELLVISHFLFWLEARGLAIPTVGFDGTDYFVSSPPHPALTIASCLDQDWTIDGL